MWKAKARQAPCLVGVVGGWSFFLQKEGRALGRSAFATMVIDRAGLASETITAQGGNGERGGGEGTREGEHAGVELHMGWIGLVRT